MPLCHKCGKEIPRKTGVYRTIKTGKYSGGSDYYRSVNLCPRCAELMETEEKSSKGKRSALVLIVGIVVVGLAVYYLYFNK
jgi:uncharacterized protein (DUF983 family)